MPLPFRFTSQPPYLIVHADRLWTHSLLPSLTLELVSFHPPTPLDSRKAPHLLQSPALYSSSCSALGLVSWLNHGPPHHSLYWHAMSLLHFAASMPRTPSISRYFSRTVVYKKSDHNVCRTAVSDHDNPCTLHPVPLCKPSRIITHQNFEVRCFLQLEGGTFVKCALSSSSSALRAWVCFHRHAHWPYMSSRYYSVHS